MAKFNLDTEYREAEVVVGATLVLSLRDAKTLLWLTERNPVVTRDMQERGLSASHAFEQNSETLRIMMREIATKILDSGIEMTETSRLFEDLTGKEISEAFDQHGA